MRAAVANPVPAVANPVPGVVYPPAERLRGYVTSGALPALTLVEALERSLTDHAERVALATADRTLTYAEVDRITRRFAASLLARGLRPLDRVLFQAGNSVELVLAFLGTLRAGLVPVCTLAAHREREILYLGRHVDARAMIVDGPTAKFDLVGFALRMQADLPSVSLVLSLGADDRVPSFEALCAESADDTAALTTIERDPFQIAVFQLSGGTTGVPKVIPRFQNDYLLNAQLTVERLGFAADDVMFNPMQIIHNACMICFLLPTLLSGAEFLVAADNSPEAWAAVMATRRPTWIGLIRPLVPRLEAALEIDPDLMARIRRIWCPDAARMMRERFGVPALPMFGMSEGMCMYPAADDPEEARDWTAGYPLSPADEIRLVSPETGGEVPAGEPGEMQVRGPYTLAGYFDAPDRNAEAFTADGFYRTGDLMVRRTIGGKTFYAFAGRTRDVVDRGREKISCEEVETVVSGHDAVAACAVVGMPDAILGERVCAFVVTRARRTGPDVPALAAHCAAAGLAKFKWPERVEIVATLPVTKVGKLDKAAMRDAVAAKLAAEAKAVPA